MKFNSGIKHNVQLKTKTIFQKLSSIDGNVFHTLYMNLFIFYNHNLSHMKQSSTGKCITQLRKTSYRNLLIHSYAYELFCIGPFSAANLLNPFFIHFFHLYFIKLYKLNPRKQIKQLLKLNFLSMILTVESQHYNFKVFSL